MQSRQPTSVAPVLSVDDALHQKRCEQVREQSKKLFEEDLKPRPTPDHLPLYNITDKRTFHHTTSTATARRCQHGYALRPNLSGVVAIRDPEVRDKHVALKYIRADHAAANTKAAGHYMYVTRDKIPKLPREFYDDDEDELVTAYRVKHLDRQVKRKSKAAEMEQLRREKEREARKMVMEQDKELDLVPMMPLDEVEEEDEDESSVEESEEEEDVDAVRCCVCGLTDIADPQVSSCKHICCGDCWRTWLSRAKTCPECRADVDMEKLTPVPVCGICEQILVAPQLPGWAAPCGHQCCRPCWDVYLADIQECPVCNTPCDADQLELQGGGGSDSDVSDSESESVVSDDEEEEEESGKEEEAAADDEESGKEDVSDKEEEAAAEDEASEEENEGADEEEEAVAEEDANENDGADEEEAAGADDSEVEAAGDEEEAAGGVEAAGDEEEDDNGDESD